MSKTNLPHLSPELQAATEQLAEALLQTGAVADYQAALGRLEADEVAQALLEKITLMQAKVRQNQAGGDLPRDTINAIRELQAQARKSPVIMGFVSTQQAALAYLPEVNHEISQHLGLDFAALGRPAGGGC
jgi:cell fate (sporulation/competence/biofilm development) regulator YlbF (YheA/YmcA/DUF963 family)